MTLFQWIWLPSCPGRRRRAGFGHTCHRDDAAAFRNDGSPRVIGAGLQPWPPADLKRRGKTFNSIDVITDCIRDDLRGRHKMVNGTLSDQPADRTPAAFRRGSAPRSPWRRQPVDRFCHCFLFVEFCWLPLRVHVSSPPSSALDDRHALLPAMSRSNPSTVDFDPDSPDYVLEVDAATDASSLAQLVKLPGSKATPR